MKTPQRPAIEAHNAFQRAYCEGFVAGTILPKAVSPHLERQVDEVVAAAALRPGVTALEVGCGMGRFTSRLAARGVAIEGLDLSPVLLQRFRELNPSAARLALHAGDLLDPPAPLHDRFDAVVGFFVLHHLADLDAAFKSVARLVKPGGRVAFVDANGWNPLFYVQILATSGMSWRGDKGMLRMRAAVVSRAMQRAGLVGFTSKVFGQLPSVVADQPWGAALDSALDRMPLPRVCRAYRIFAAERPLATSAPAAC